jgi:hypothetical protein
MWVRFALAAFAIVALQDSAGASSLRIAATGAAPMRETGADQGASPPFKPMNFPARGDALDEWCRDVKSGSIVAICSDDELRALAIQRLAAFNEAVSRLPPNRQRVLAADQNGWALSSPQACGVWANLMPSLPIAPGVRDCLAKAGRARLAYLRAYGLPAAGGPPSAATASGVPAPAPEPAQLPPAQLPPAPSPPASPQPTAAPLQSDAPAHSGATPGEVSLLPGKTPAAPADQGLSNPLARRPVLLTGIRGVGVVGVALVAATVIGLWLWAAFRNGRRRSRNGGKLSPAAMPARQAHRVPDSQARNERDA